MARTITFEGLAPVRMIPPIMTLSPVSTRPRVEIFTWRDRRLIRIDCDGVDELIGLTVILVNIGGYRPRIWHLFRMSYVETIFGLTYPHGTKSLTQRLWRRSF